MGSNYFDQCYYPLLFTISFIISFPVYFFNYYIIEWLENAYTIYLFLFLSIICYYLYYLGFKSIILIDTLLFD